MSQSQAFKRLEKQVVCCTLCPRLVAYRRQVSREKKRAYRDYDYWGKPVPGMGDPDARVLLVGLAPAPHGSNRTGRMFTGDGSDGHGAGDFLMSALHRAGLANRPSSQDRGDGLELIGAYLTAIVRCAPPQNKPTSEEIAHCAQYLDRELDLLSRVRVVVALGKLAFDQVLRTLAGRGAVLPRPRPRFGHGTSVAFGEGYPLLLGSYHPSRQNTQTGKLTKAMLDRVFRKACRLAERE